MTGHILRVNNHLRVCLRILFDGRRPTVARAACPESFRGPRLRVQAASRRSF
jgi:hypothetical protein